MLSLGGRITILINSATIWVTPNCISVLDIETDHHHLPWDNFNSNKFRSNLDAFWIGFVLNNETNDYHIPCGNNSNSHKFKYNLDCPLNWVSFKHQNQLLSSLVRQYQILVNFCCHMDTLYIGHIGFVQNIEIEHYHLSSASGAVSFPAKTSNFRHIVQAEIDRSPIFRFHPIPHSNFCFGKHKSIA